MDVSHQIKRFADVTGAMRAARASAERERWSPAALEAHRTERLSELARRATEGSPFWRDRLSGALRADGSLDLSAVPPLTKSEMMEHWDDAVTDRRLRRDEVLDHLDGLDHDAMWLGEYRAMTTSGSSGLKGLFVYDRPAWRGLLMQFFRYNAFVGVGPRLPRRLRVGAVGGTAPTHMSQRLAATAGIGINRVMPLSVTSPVVDLVAALNSFQPDHFHSYPSVAAVLADEQIAGRLRIAPKTISTSSELRTAETAEKIAQAFGVRPYDLFGTTEGLWGCECEERCGMHLFDDMCIVENVDEDGHPVPAGEVGARLLVTNLFNRTQPLIRFEVTDLVAVEPEPCPCGRSLMRVRSLEGRAEEVLRLGGVTVHPLEFALVTADPDVREFQVVQRGDGLRLRVALRAGADGAPERLRARLGARLEELGVSRPAVEVETVEALERSASGKLQMVVAGRT